MDNGDGGESRGRSVSVQMKKHSVRFKEELVVSDNEDPDEEGLEEGDNISQTSSINYWSRSAMRRGSGEWPLHHRNSQNMIIPPSLVSSISPIPMINLSDNVSLTIDE